MVNAIIITMNKMVENFIYSPFCSLYFFINIFFLFLYITLCICVPQINTLFYSSL